MVDITMCKNTKCKIKDKCFRFLAKPDEYYQGYVIMDDKEVTSPDECDLYYECKPLLALKNI